MIFLSLRVTADAEGGLKGPARPRRSLRGLGGVSHQQASAGIYRRIACHYYRTPVRYPHGSQKISCSRASNSGVEKNSPSVISKPSHNFLIVTVPGFWLSPLRILLMVACGTAEILLRPLGVMPRFLHSSRIRAAIASRVFIGKSSK